MTPTLRRLASILARSPRNGPGQVGTDRSHGARRIRRPAAVLAGLAAVAAAPLLAAPARAAASTGPPLNIVALGDSYASGQGDEGSGWLDATCYRSYYAAARYAEQQLNKTNRPVNFTFLACNGSTISNSNPAQSLLGTGGQLDTALSMADPNGTDPIDAMTISIGGNNIGFANIVQDCMMPGNSCPTDPNVTGIPGLGTVPQALQVLGGYPADPGALGELVQQVNSHPDIENVYLTEYPDPTTGPVGAAGDNTCGSPNDPNSATGLMSGISAADASWASTSVIQPLNLALQAAVSMGNSQPGTHAAWHYVSGISSAFNTHGYCNPNTGPNGRFINTLTDSLAEQHEQTGTMHPNDEGQQAIAGILYNDYVTGKVMSASVSVSPPAVAGTPTNLTVQALSFAGTPVANAAVLVDGTQVGTTNSSGTLVVSDYEFPTAGNHTIVTQENGWASGRAVVAVQPRPYTVASSPSPIPVKTLIPALTLTATDTVTGQAVPGTFTFEPPGAAALSVREGATASNVTVPMGHKTESIIGPTGKPIQITVPACPTLTFQPDSAAYASQDFTKLISCTASP